MYQLRYAAITHPGKKRMNNEDNFYINSMWKKDMEQNSMKVLGCVDSGKLLAAVFDGMGGSSDGKRASFLAAENMYAYDKMLINGNAVLLRNNKLQYLEMANEAICWEMCESRKQMGTTFAVLEFVDEMVVAQNIGDSRIYRYSNQILERISTDHTIVASLVRSGLITEEDTSMRHMNHQITQYLGIPKEEMCLEPATTELFPLCLGDKFLICSDGLTDMLTDSEITKVIESTSTTENIAEQLIKDALIAGGTDNITVCVIEVI